MTTSSINVPGLGVITFEFKNDIALETNADGRPCCYNASQFMAMSGNVAVTKYEDADGVVCPCPCARVLRLICDPALFGVDRAVWMWLAEDHVLQPTVADGMDIDVYVTDNAVWQLQRSMAWPRS